MTTFDQGLLWDPSTTPPANTDMPEVQQVAEWWPFFCHSQKVFMKDPESTRVWVPRLTHWGRAGSLEFFEIEIRGRLNEQADKLVKALASARGAKRHTVKTVNGDPFHLRIVLNHATIPTLVHYDPTEDLPEDESEFYLGASSVGPACVWDPDKNPHALLVGKTGSGKTAACSLLLTQLHQKGGTAVVCTPTPNDANLTPFDGLEGWTVICGQAEEDLLRMAVACAEVVATLDRREAETGERRMTTTDEPYLFVVLDEPGWVLNAQPGDTDEMRDARELISSCFLQVAQRGRKSRIELVMMTQAPYADEFGGDLRIPKQAGLRLAFRELAADMWPVIFGKPDTAEVAEIRSVLVPASVSPPGRGIGVGFEQPGEPWDDFSVNVSAMQGAYVDPDVRDAMLRTSASSVVTPISRGNPPHPADGDVSPMSADPVPPGSASAAAVGAAQGHGVVLRAVPDPADDLAELAEAVHRQNRAAAESVTPTLELAPNPDHTFDQRSADLVVVAMLGVLFAAIVGVTLLSPLPPLGYAACAGSFGMWGIMSTWWAHHRGLVQARVVLGVAIIVGTVSIAVAAAWLGISGVGR